MWVAVGPLKTSLFFPTAPPHHRGLRAMRTAAHPTSGLALFSPLQSSLNPRQPPFCTQLPLRILQQHGPFLGPQAHHFLLHWGPSSCLECLHPPPPTSQPFLALLLALLDSEAFSATPQHPRAPRPSLHNSVPPVLALTPVEGSLGRTGHGGRAPAAIPGQRHHAGPQCPNGPQA